MPGNSDRECSWLINGIAVNPDGPVRPGYNEPPIGTLRAIANDLPKRSMLLWRVDGVGVNPEGMVVRGPSDAQIGQVFGSLGQIVEENQRLKAELEKLGIEHARRGSDIDYLNIVLQGSRAKQDELQAERDKLRVDLSKADEVRKGLLADLEDTRRCRNAALVQRDNLLADRGERTLSSVGYGPGPTVKEGRIKLGDLEQMRPPLKGAGYVAPPTVASGDNATMGSLPVEAIVNNVPNLVRALAPLRCGGIHLDAPAGSIITITLPKE